MKTKASQFILLFLLLAGAIAWAGFSLQAEHIFAQNSDVQEWLKAGGVLLAFAFTLGFLLNTKSQTGHWLWSGTCIAILAFNLAQNSLLDPALQYQAGWYSTFDLLRSAGWPLAGICLLSRLMPRIAIVATAIWSLTVFTSYTTNEPNQAQLSWQQANPCKQIVLKTVFPEYTFSVGEIPQCKLKIGN